MTDFICGGLAGITSKCITSPIDVVRLHFATHTNLVKCPKNAHGIGLNSFSKGAQAVYSQEGVFGLWSGNSAALLRLFPYSGIKFVMYDHVKAHWLVVSEEEKRGNTKSASAMGKTALAGSISGVIASIATFPLDMARVRLAVQTMHRSSLPSRGLQTLTVPSFGEAKLYACSQSLPYKSPLQTVWKVGSVEGMRGVYRGMGLSLFGVTLHEGLRFGAYGFFKFEANKALGIEPPFRLNVPQVAICGYVAGWFASVISYPVDVMRKRLIAQSLVSSYEYKSAVDTLDTMVKEEGLVAFYRGWTGARIKTPIQSAIVFSIYELLTNQLDETG